MSALSPRQMFLLDHACQPLREAFPSYGPYLVGTASERGPYRDVDVRLIMEDAEYDKLAEAVGMPAIWFLGLGLGQYLASLTGLPIDFQFQRATEANKAHEYGCYAWEIDHWSMGVMNWRELLTGWKYDPYNFGADMFCPEHAKDPANV